MGEDLSNQEKFQQMLATDKKVFEMLASMQIFLSDPKAKSNPDYNKVLDSYNALKLRYNARQDDYKNNALYRLGNTITEYADKTIEWFKSAWASLFGIGVAPLVVPVAIAAGAVLTVSVVTYFVYKYYSETSIDYNEALKDIELVARHNPELAKRLADQLNDAKKDEDSSSFFSQLGQGVKFALGAVGISVAGAAVYGIGKKFNWF